MVSKNPRFPEELLISLNKDETERHDAYRLNIGTGEITLVARDTGNVNEWIPDRNLEVRGCVAARSDGGFDVMLREQGGWRELVCWDSEDSMSSSPVGFSHNGEYLYLRDSCGADTARLVRLQTSTGEATVIAEHQSFDVDDVLVHPRARDVQAVAFYQARREWTVLDADIETDMRTLENLHRGDLSIVGRDRKDAIWVCPPGI